MQKEKEINAESAIPDYDHLFTESVEKGKVKNGFIKKLLKLNVGGIIISCLLYIIQFSPVLITPLLTANIINIVTNVVTTGAEMSASAWEEIAINTGIMLFFILLNVPITRIRYRVVSKILRSTSAGIKVSVVRKLQSLSITYHRDMESGKIQSKFLKDTDSFDMFFNLLLQSVLVNIISVIAAIIVAVLKSGLVSLFFLLVIPVNVGLSFAFRNKIKTKARDFRVNNENMGARLTTMIEMMPVTKAHGLEGTELHSVGNFIGKVEGAGRSLDSAVGHFGALNWAINTLLNSSCVVFCAILAVKKIIPIGDIVLYQSLFTTISSYVSTVIAVYPQLATGVEAANSLSELMNVKDVEVNMGKVDRTNINGDIKFEDVTYVYPKTVKPIIKNLFLDVKAGECIAIVGSSGSGKTTLVNMVIGFLKPTSGKLYIDGKEINEYTLSEYRHNISVVPQNAVLFSGTIKENITYGMDNYSEEDVERVIELANVKEFLGELNNGIDTVVGEHGDKLSGGQKQRITIARALIRNPKILILDEATSALDKISEYHVQKAIAKSIRGRTTFIVAHRLSTIRNADRIIVMESGRIVEIGTYEELMDKKGKFYELKKLNDMNSKAAEKALGMDVTDE